MYNLSSLFDALTSKAAYLLWCLITNHPFIDGNKRTAFESADVFLRANGYEIGGIEQDEIVSVLTNVASGDLVLNDLISWLRTHLRPVR